MFENVIFVIKTKNCYNLFMKESEQFEVEGVEYGHNS